MKAKYKNIVLGILGVCLCIGVVWVSFFVYKTTQTDIPTTEYDLIIEEENIFRDTYHSFLGNTELKDFQNLSENFQSFSLLSIWILRLQDRESWIKLFELKYDTDIELSKNILKTPLKNKEGYITYITKLYDDVVAGVQLLPTEDEVSGGNDMLITFSDYPLERALADCTYSQKSDNVATYCSDSIYFYRATQENNYCSKIQDEYAAQLCTDFLKYEE